MSVDNFIAFIKERHAIYMWRYEGRSKPWTSDPILQQYRFCNVFRELDTVTQWIARNWRTPYADDPNLWFAMTVARLVNWPETLEELTPVLFSKGEVSWYPKQFIRVLHGRKKRGEKVHTGAYMMRCDAMADGEDKADYLANAVLTPLWKARKQLCIDLKMQKNFTWAAWHEKLTEFHGIGSFLAAQVVADVKYAWPYLKVSDWWTFAASGPGSRRGLNRVLGRPVDALWKEREWRAELARLHAVVRPIMAEVCKPEMHAQDLQNCLCEYFKYEKVRLGEGRPRSKYNGGAE
jgi:hypothetical protein